MPTSDLTAASFQAQINLPITGASTNDTGQNGFTQQAQGSTTETQDAIRESKQKAKALVAASGMTPGACILQPSSRGHSQSPGIVVNRSAFQQPSRKRSRSGSRIHNHLRPVNASNSPQPLLKDLYLDQFVLRDEIHYAALINDNERQKNLITRMMKEKDHYMELRSGRTADVPFKTVYPKNRKRPWDRKTKELRIQRTAGATQADQLEELAPIRLDLEFEKLRLRDTFTWNIHDRVVPMDLFVDGLVEDFKIPSEAVVPLSQQVLQNMHEQILDFHPHPFISEEPLDPHLPYSAYKNDEMRILIKLNITIGQHSLVDQFDWDINSPLNSPETFAQNMARDMSLSGEFMTAIAASIREQTQLFTKGLYIASHPFDGRPVHDVDLRDGFLPSPLTSVFRPFQSAKEFAPCFYELNEADLERTELAFAREQRQQKRSVNRRGGPAMPDLKERLPVMRTMVVSSVIPGAAESMEKSGIHKFTRTSGRGRKNYRADLGEEDDLSEEEESLPGSPVKTQGLNRTRGMRGAASAAQAAMRANLATSVSPEPNGHHHETRTIARRSGGYDTREETAEPTSLIVILRMPRERYRQWLRDRKARQQQQQLQRPQPPPHQLSYHGVPFPVSHSSTPQYSRPMQNPLNPPQPTPAMMQRQLPGPQPGYEGPGHLQRHPSMEPVHHMRQRYTSQVDAVVETPPPPMRGQPLPPPAPAWLTVALGSLRVNYPGHAFEPIMRYNPEMQQWNPRLRCIDCPGKVYNTTPQDPVGNFRVHLNNYDHKKKVDARLARGG